MNKKGKGQCGRGSQRGLPGGGDPEAGLEGYIGLEFIKVFRRRAGRHMVGRVRSGPGAGRTAVEGTIAKGVELEW